MIDNVTIVVENCFIGKESIGDIIKQYLLDMAACQAIVNNPKDGYNTYDMTVVDSSKEDK